MSGARELPPLSIKGGNHPPIERTETTVAIHWLTATVNPPGPPNRYAAGQLADRLNASITGDGSPYPRSYTHGVELDPGRISWHESEPRMKLCFNLTGGDCEEWYADGRFLSPLVSTLYAGEANFTRIDAALDYHGDANIGDLVDAFEVDPGWTSVRTLRPFQELTNGSDGVSRIWSGVYIGSRSSERFLRVYDKALETGSSGRWTRIELVSRNDYANAFGENITMNGLAPAARGTIRQVADCPIDWWQDALAGDAAESPPVGRKVADTDRWLIDKVLPVLERRLMLCHSTRDELFRVYDLALNDHRRRLHQLEKHLANRG